MNDSYCLKFFVCATLLLQTMIGFCQSIRFTEFYDVHSGADVIDGVIESEDNNIIVAGTSLNLTDNINNYDAFQILVNQFGAVINSERITRQGHSYSHKNVINSKFSDAIFACGHHCDYTIESSGYCDFYFSKLDNTGDTIFTKIIERPDTTDRLLSMVETRPNTILLMGWTYNDTTSVNSDVFLVAVDTLGNVLNRTVYGGTGTDFVRSGVIINEAGETLLTGFTESFPSPSIGRTWTVRTDSVGNVIEHRTYSGFAGNNSSGQQISSLSDGSFLIVGAHTSGSTKALLLKVDENGESIWQKSITRGTEGQAFWGGGELSDGSLVASGPTNVTNDGSQAGWLAKMSSIGDTLWTRVYNPSNGTDYLRNMMVMDNGDIVMVGFGRGENSTSQDGWILRVDSMGCVVEDCHLVGIEESSTVENGFSVYPNPVNDLLNIETKQGRIKQVDIYNAFGALVHSETGSAQQKRIEVSGFVAGVYLLMVETDQGVSSTKLVLE